MLQLRNQTPLQAALAVFPDARGIDTLILAVKATFTLAPALALCDEQTPIRLTDEPEEPQPTQESQEAGISNEARDPLEIPNPLRHPGELSLCRPATDVLILGSAHAPSGRPVEQLDVSVRIGSREVGLRVFGDREWTGAALGATATAPRPFVQMPLSYRRAFGGMVRGDGGVRSEERNPVGVGFAAEQRGERLRGRPLPNLEDPRCLLRSPGECPRPLSLGAIAPGWLPRRAFAGTYDSAWQASRAPFLPADFDPRFLQVAHPELVQPGRLRGGEPVRLRGLSRDGGGLLEFTLPELLLSARVRLGTELLQPPLQLAQVLIEPDRARLELLFDAAIPCPRGALQVREIELGLQATSRGAAAA